MSELEFFKWMKLVTKNSNTMQLANYLGNTKIQNPNPSGHIKEYNMLNHEGKKIC
jgi:hypothetical protein